MPELEVWKMVRDLERNQADRRRLWRAQLAGEHPGAGSRRLRFWQRLRGANGAISGERPVHVASRRAIPGDGR
ncbi:MAG TPA: hypothetical protein VKV26_25590 [Dehalococcoidia bacterium]|nr:hypothetical protein [Dehalococcoidia bacterium]